MKKLVIIGAGGFGLEVAAYAEDCGEWVVEGFLDDTKPVGSFHAGYPILGPTTRPLDPAASYVLAVGWPEHRHKLAAIYEELGARFASLIHPRAYVSSSAILGLGCIVAPFAFIGPAARLGRQVLVNVHAVIGHEAQVGDYAVLSPLAGVHGAARLAMEVFMGSGGQIARGVTVGARSRVAAGAVVYGDIPPDQMALGNPARHGPLAEDKVS